MARPYGCRELEDVCPDPCNSRSAELPAPAATVCEKESDPDADLGLVALQALQGLLRMSLMTPLFSDLADAASMVITL